MNPFDVTEPDILSQMRRVAERQGLRSFRAGMHYPLKQFSIYGLLDQVMQAHEIAVRKRLRIVGSRREVEIDDRGKEYIFVTIWYEIDRRISLPDDLGLIA